MSDRDPWRDLAESSEEPYRRPSSGWLVGPALLAAIIGGIGFIWSYLADSGTPWLGGFLALILAGIGAALASWGRDLAGDRPVAGRYPLPADDEEGQEALAEELSRDVNVVTRRRFLTTLLAAAVGLFGLSALFLIGSLGPRPKRQLFTTAWSEGARLVTADGEPVTRDMFAKGGMVVAFPEGHTDAADSQIAVLQITDKDFKPVPGRESWSPEGFVAFSRVCTHAGCPVAQYEDDQQILLCPCHQSGFDLLNGAQPVSGPAGRPLPQLPLAIQGPGELVAQSDFQTPIGPGFWDLK